MSSPHHSDGERVECRSCHGTGLEAMVDNRSQCFECGGSGEAPDRILNPDWPAGDEPYSEKSGEPCPACSTADGKEHHAD